MSVNCFCYLADFQMPVQISHLPFFQVFDSVSMDVADTDSPDGIKSAKVFVAVRCDCVKSHNDFKPRHDRVKRMANNTSRFLISSVNQVISLFNDRTATESPNVVTERYPDVDVLRDGYASSFSNDAAGGLNNNAGGLNNNAGGLSNNAGGSNARVVVVKQDGIIGQVVNSGALDFYSGKFQTPLFALCFRALGPFPPKHFSSCLKQNQGPKLS